MSSQPKWRYALETIKATKGCMITKGKRGSVPNKGVRVTEVEAEVEADGVGGATTRRGRAANRAPVAGTISFSDSPFRPSKSVEFDLISE